MTNLSANTSNDYLFQSRILSHVLFWLGYYVVFSILWAKEGNYYASFGLEFVLMPIRISAAYVTMYYLMPYFLLRDRIGKFIGYLVLTLILAGMLQRIFIYFFHQLFFEEEANIPLWDLFGVVRAMVLVNSTVLFLSAIKMYKFWRAERDQNIQESGGQIEIRSDKRTHRVSISNILYIEGLGNYVTYYLENKKPLISYQSLKETEQELPEYFTRIHKSFVVNKNKIESYTTDNVQIDGRVIPIGKSMTLEF